jgi:hypothetical protein
MRKEDRKGSTAHESKDTSEVMPDGKTSAPARRVSEIRKSNRLKDEVYREMLLIEVSRPGAEMGLALALLRAVVQSGSLAEQSEFEDWLKTICPVGLRMIEVALAERRECDSSDCA